MYRDVSGVLPAGQPRGVPISNPLRAGGCALIYNFQSKMQRTYSSLKINMQYIGSLAVS